MDSIVGRRSAAGMLVVIACLACVAINCVDAGLVYPMRSPGHYPDVAMPKKRPFCNAFTGCGRKRSDPELQAPAASTHQQQLQQSFSPSSSSPSHPHQPYPFHPPQPNALNGLDDTLGDLLDLNSEPAVEDLMRQIMSQAKMWEAIQEANREMIIQKNDRNSMVGERPNGIGSGFPTVQFNSQ